MTAHLMQRARSSSARGCCRGRDVRIAHLWAEPFAAAELRPRLSKRTETVREMIDLLEQEAAAEAERIAAEGVVLAEAAGWKAEPVLKRAYGAQGLELASLAEELEAEMLVVGSRGLTGPARCSAASPTRPPTRPPCRPWSSRASC